MIESDEDHDEDVGSKVVPIQQMGILQIYVILLASVSKCEDSEDRNCIYEGRIDVIYI